MYRVIEQMNRISVWYNRVTLSRKLDIAAADDLLISLNTKKLRQQPFQFTALFFNVGEMPWNGKMVTW